MLEIVTFKKCQSSPCFWDWENLHATQRQMGAFLNPPIWTSVKDYLIEIISAAPWPLETVVVSQKAAVGQGRWTWVASWAGCRSTQAARPTRPTTITLTRSTRSIRSTRANLRENLKVRQRGWRKKMEDKSECLAHFWYFWVNLQGTPLSHACELKSAFLCRGSSIGFLLSVWDDMCRWVFPR